MPELSERERVERVVEEMERARPVVRVGDMAYIQPEGRARRFRAEDDPRYAIPIHPDQLGMSGPEPTGPRIVIPASVVAGEWGSGAVRKADLTSFDEGDVYSFTGLGPGVRVRGSIHRTTSDSPVSPDSFGDPGDKVRVVFYRNRASDLSRGDPVFDAAEGFVRTHSEWRKAIVQVLPLRRDLFARHQGLYETDVVADKTVAVFGLGSVGGEIGLNLGQSGICSMFLADKDRYDVPNVARQIAPVSYVGRYKTRGAADVLREKNPFIDVKCFEFEVSRKTKELVREIVKQADVVVCALDEPRARRVINEVCVEEGKACVYGGLRRRAYGGQVLFVEPGKSPCLACYEAEMPESAADRRISRPEQAERIAYSDLPVAVEPGLALDIKPIALMMTKLALQHLLRGKETTLRSLDEDLVASLYIWFSRREPDTPFARLEPLGFEMSGLRILRWFGIPLERRSDCPVCGDFVGRTAERYGIDRREVEAGIRD